jgi:hypothetical protein
VEGSHYCDEEQDPDPHRNEKLDPDPYLSDAIRNPVPGTKHLLTICIQ